jgi:hypothetical protein
MLDAYQYLQDELLKPVIWWLERHPPEVDSCQHEAHNLQEVGPSKLSRDFSKVSSGFFQQDPNEAFRLSKSAFKLSGSIACREPGTMMTLTRQASMSAISTCRSARYHDTNQVLRIENTERRKRASTRAVDVRIMSIVPFQRSRRRRSVLDRTTWPGAWVSLTREPLLA